MLILLSGCSGAGKNTVINELASKDKKVKKFITYTTRDMRDGEVNHVNYHFITKDEFLEKQNRNEFLEVECIHENMYGSSGVDLFNEIQNGFTIINDFGVEGVKNLKDKLNGKVQIVTIFLNVPKDELKDRLVKRGDKADNIEVRMKRYEYENSFAKDYDFIIDNVDLDKTVKIIQQIISDKRSERTIEK